MPLTREQAEAAGWRTYKAPDLVGAVYFAEADCSRYRILASGLSDDAANASVLAAITAIESYPSAVALLEECKGVIAELKREIYPGHFDYASKQAVDEADAFLVKLEAL